MTIEVVEPPSKEAGGRHTTARCVSAFFLVLVPAMLILLVFIIFLFGYSIRALFHPVIIFEVFISLVLPVILRIYGYFQESSRLEVGMNVWSIRCVFLGPIFGIILMEFVYPGATALEKSLSWNAGGLLFIISLVIWVLIDHFLDIMIWGRPKKKK